MQSARPWQRRTRLATPDGGEEPRMTESPTVTVNGHEVPLGDVAPHTTVLDWLRGRGLTGCKEGCAEGECGACSVLVARPGLDAATEWTALNACLLPAASLPGQEVVTAEYYRTGRGSDALADGEHGPNGFDLHALSGNLCRCTGYRPIRDAAYALEEPAVDDLLAP